MGLGLRCELGGYKRLVPSRGDVLPKSSGYSVTGSVSFDTGRDLGKQLNRVGNRRFLACCKPGGRVWACSGGASASQQARSLSARPPEGGFFCTSRQGVLPTGPLCAFLVRQLMGCAIQRPEAWAAWLQIRAGPAAWGVPPRTWPAPWLCGAPNPIPPAQRVGKDVRGYRLTPLRF